MVDPAVVSTPAGSLAGATSVGGGLIFAGIPFATPPLGENRFRAPQPITGWSGLREAKCYQPAPLQTGLEETSEDCLYLNVWTPSTAGCRPVIVYVYGGGFEVGSSSPPTTDAAALSRKADVVVVAMNYRLGALGWLCVDGIANVGLQDQVAALQWVRESIQYFGGDHENITLMGQSAGASSVSALFGTPSALGLFDKAILQSGSAGRLSTSKTAKSVASDFFGELRVSTVDELRRISGQRILAAQATVVSKDIGMRNSPSGHAWGVVQDGAIVTESPLAVVRRGGIAQIPILVTTTRDELLLSETVHGAGYAPSDEDSLRSEMQYFGVKDETKLLIEYRRREPGASLARLRSRFLTDVIYQWPADWLVEAQVAGGGHAYRAQFVGEPFGSVVGACHASDLPYVFANFRGGLLAAPDEPAHHAISDQVIASWSRFARTGDPGWAEFRTDVIQGVRKLG